MSAAQTSSPPPLADDSVLIELRARWPAIGSMRCGIVSAVRFVGRPVADARPITSLDDIVAQWHQLPKTVRLEVKRLLAAAPVLSGPKNLPVRNPRGSRER